MVVPYGGTGLRADALEADEDARADIPGWKDSQHPEFDSREAAIVPAIRDASFKINGLKVPSTCPVPARPGRPWLVQHPQGGPAICFTGSAWAHRYRVAVGPTQGTTSPQVVEVSDATKEDHFVVHLGREYQACGGPAQVTVWPISVDGAAGEPSEPLLL